MKLVKNKIINEVLEWVICFAIAYVIYLVINWLFGTISGVKQTSMHPTIQNGERVVVARRVIYNKEIKKEDIVTLVAPDGEAKEDSVCATYDIKTGFSKFVYDILEIGKTSYIKRVIAVAGDHIYIDDTGKVYINDNLLEEEYLPQDTLTPRLGTFYDVIVPEGYVFVMGDNREVSKDSREFGCVPLDKIEGVVHIRIWPLNKIGEI